jgi:hypothetical protein
VFNDILVGHARYGGQSGSARLTPTTGDHMKKEDKKFGLGTATGIAIGMILHRLLFT